MLTGTNPRKEVIQASWKTFFTYVAGGKVFHLCFCESVPKRDPHITQRDSLAIFYFVRALWPNKSCNMHYIIISLCRSQSYKSRELCKKECVCVCSPRICNFWCLFCVISLALKSAFSSLFTQKIPALTSVSVSVSFWTPFTYTFMCFNVCVCVCVVCVCVCVCVCVFLTKRKECSLCLRAEVKPGCRLPTATG